MVQVVNVKKLVSLLLLVLVLDLSTAENAQARRRCFGRRNRGVSARSNNNRNFNRNFNRFVANNGFFNNRNFNRFNNDFRFNINDPFALARQPADIFSSLTLDPTGSVQRLALAPNIGVNRRGQFFELNGVNDFGIRQALAFSNGQFFGGQLSNVSADTLQQMQILNQTGNFDTLPFQ